MNRLHKLSLLAFASIASMVLLTSCTDEERTAEDVIIDYEALAAQEQAVLNDVMSAANLPNTEMMPEGYYMQIEPQAGSGDSSKGRVLWARYNITSSDMSNFGSGELGNSNINLTRNDELATYLQGTYNPHTHYIPVLKYVYGSQYDVIDLALTNTDNVYVGTEFKVYSPYAFASDNVNGSYGFAGSDYLDSYKSFQSTVQIVDLIDDMDAEEDSQISVFLSNNSGFELHTGTDEEDVEQTYSGLYAARNVNDINNIYESPYAYKTLLTLLDLPTIQALNDKINEAIDSRDFISYTDGELVETNTVNVWYIARFLDGYIFDTNIDEVREIVFLQDSDTSSSAYSFTSTDESSIEAWNLLVPTFRYGQWNKILTTSGYAYGESGTSGSSTSTEIQPYTPLIFDLYIEPAN